jgi:hypothetical protein
LQVFGFSDKNNGADLIKEKNVNMRLIFNKNWLFLSELTTAKMKTMKIENRLKISAERSKKEFFLTE